MRDLHLVEVERTHPHLRRVMKIHYSQPNGFVGRTIAYAVISEGECYGFVAAGSATKFLPGRAGMIGEIPLNNIVNNVFYHVERVAGRYPFRNFTTAVVALWRRRIAVDWKVKYGDRVDAAETLVEMPRTGELYRRDGWREVGVTKGQTCKRVGGVGTDSWTGKRVWDTINLRPKRVFIRYPMLDTAENY